jgi:ACS family hexuronate transporter-like MFS transporter
MAPIIPATNAPPRGPAWKWWVCGLLLLATVINYMDRQTLAQTAQRIKSELHLSNEQYGQIELAFSIAFALGALLAGGLADRINVRWLYPAALLGWSLAGFCTGFAPGFGTLLACRFALGLFEAGNWPCALRTTQRILRPDQRTLGNGILQSGAAFGAIITPSIVLLCYGDTFLRWLAANCPPLAPALEETLSTGIGRWRYPFFCIGAAGTVWVLLWLLSVRRADLALPAFTAPTVAAPDKHEASVTGVFRDRRFYALLVLVITINLTWHFFRAWLPLFLHETHDYSEDHVQYFMMGYYAAADAGALTIGFSTLLLARAGMPVHRTRALAFSCCTVLTALSVVVAFLPACRLLLVLLLVIAFGALGLFPAYYSLSQELTFRHQGKVTGMLGCSTWLAVGAMQPLVGRWIDQTKSYSLGIVLAGLYPLIGLLALLLIWKVPRSAHTEEPAKAVLPAT